MDKVQSCDGPLAIFAAIAITSSSVGAQPSRTDNLIPQLIRQLGHEDYVAREVASRELIEVGESAMPALQSAAATDADPEIRWRAQQIVQTAIVSARAAAMRKAVKELQGTWTLVSSEAGGKQVGGEDGSYILPFKETGGRSRGRAIVPRGTVTCIEVKEKLNAIDLAITEGSNVGVTAISIYAVEENTLKYINSPEPRATEFATKPGDDRGYSIFRRATLKP